MKSTFRRTLLSFLLVTVMVVCGSAMLASEAKAGVTVDVYGVKVTYSKYGMDAYYDSSDGTVTVYVMEPYGNLNITVTPNAYYYFNYVDLYIYSPYSLNAMTIKGLNANGMYVPAFLVGQIYYTKTATFWNGWSGLTDYYPTYGLGSDYQATKITMSRAGAAYSFLGLDYGSTFDLYGTSVSVKDFKAAMKTKLVPTEVPAALAMKKSLLEKGKAQAAKKEDAAE